MPGQCNFDQERKEPDAQGQKRKAAGGGVGAGVKLSNRSLEVWGQGLAVDGSA